MTNLFKNNAYNILGLDTSVTPEDILIRSQEITSFIQSEGYPEFSLDLDLCLPIRTNESLQEAIQILQAPKKKIKDYFFWFRITDSIDEQALISLRNKDYLNAIKIWQDVSKKDNPRCFFYKLNIAILYTILLFDKKNLSYLNDSLTAWHLLIESEEFWQSFSETYKLHDELSFKSEIIIEFRSIVVIYLSDLYSELNLLHNDSTYINGFQELFSSDHEWLKKGTLNPAYESINSIVENIETIKVNKNGILDIASLKMLKKLIKQNQIELNKLTDLGLYDDPQVKSMRNRALESIKYNVLDLHNNLNETEKSISLLADALKFATSPNLEAKIKKDIKTLKEIMEKVKIVSPIINLLDEKKYEEALELIEYDKIKYGSELKEFYDKRKKICIVKIAKKIADKAQSYFNNNKLDLAIKYYEDAGKLIYDNIDLINLNKSNLEELITDIKLHSQSITLPEFQEYRSSFINSIMTKNTGIYKRLALTILLDSYLVNGLVNLMRKSKREEKIRHVGSLAVLAIFIIIAILYFKV